MIRDRSAEIGETTQEMGSGIKLGDGGEEDGVFLLAKDFFGGPDFDELASAHDGNAEWRAPATTAKPWARARFAPPSDEKVE